MSGAPALAHRIEGRADGETLVFVHGWPDGPGLWRHQVEALGDTCRCVLVTLPNYGPEPEPDGRCDFPEWVARLHATIEAVQPDGAPVTLVTHDWGAYLGYCYEKAHPERVARMVALDIGGHVAPESVKAALFMAGYQWTLIALWLLGGVWPAAGDALTQRFARALQVPMPQAAEARSRFAYPYFYFWRGTLLPWARDSLLGRCRPQCPVLFVYGARKPLMFHTARWLEIVEAGGGKHASIDAGHWFMQTHPEALNPLVADWLAS